MSLFFTDRSQAGRPDEPSLASGPLTDFGDVTGAAFEEGRVLYNFNSEQVAHELAYDRIVDRAKEATGVDLQNPYRLSFKERYIDSLGPSLRSPDNPRRLAIRKAERDFRLQYWKLQQGQREQGTPFDERLQDLNLDAEIRAIVDERQKNLVDVRARSSGLDAAAGALVGGLGAAITDPAQIAAGLTPVGASRTILSAALKGAIVSAGIETALQPTIKTWHDELGLEYTLSQGATNVVFAALLGGAFEGGASALYRGVVGSPEYREAKQRLEALPEDHTLRQVLSGKRKDVIEAAKKLETDLPPEARAALSREEGAVSAQERSPDGITGRAHENALSGAEIAVQRNLPEPAPAPSRIVERPDRPELAPLLGDELANTNAGRAARALTNLSDEAYLRVQSGELSNLYGARIAERVEDPALHASIAEDVIAARPESELEFDAVLSQSLEFNAGGDPGLSVGWSGRPPARPQSLFGFVREQGGVRESFGDDGSGYRRGTIQQWLGDVRKRPGLLNNQSGVTIDELTRRAQEAGFDVVDDDDFVRALGDEVQGGEATFRIGEGEEWRAWQDEIRERPQADVQPEPVPGPREAIREAAEIDAIVGGRDVAQIYDEAASRFGEPAAKVITTVPAEEGLFTFAGPKALSAKPEALAYAKSARRKGAEPEEIWRQTWERFGQGWYRDRGGDWVVELNTSWGYDLITSRAIGRADEILRMPDLFEQYPQLRSVIVDARQGKDGKAAQREGALGWFRSQGLREAKPSFIGRLFGATAERSVGIRIAARSEGLASSTAIHELQHAIDHIEGFRYQTRRSQPYLSRPGERRAINAEYRALWNDEERAAVPPWWTEQEAVDWFFGGVSERGNAPKYQKEGTLNTEPMRIETLLRDTSIPEEPRRESHSNPMRNDAIGFEYSEKHNRYDYDLTSNHNLGASHYVQLYGQTFLSRHELATKKRRNSTNLPDVSDETLANWDVPLKDQHPEVQKKLRALLDEYRHEDPEFERVFVHTLDGVPFHTQTDHLNPEFDQFWRQERYYPGEIMDMIGSGIYEGGFDRAWERLSDWFKRHFDRDISEDEVLRDVVKNIAKRSSTSIEDANASVLVRYILRQAFHREHWDDWDTFYRNNTVLQRAGIHGFEFRPVGAQPLRQQLDAQGFRRLAIASFNHRVADYNWAKTETAPDVGLPAGRRRSLEVGEAYKAAQTELNEASEAHRLALEGAGSSRPLAEFDRGTSIFVFTPGEGARHPTRNDGRLYSLFRDKPFEVPPRPNLVDRRAVLDDNGHTSPPASNHELTDIGDLSALNDRLGLEASFREAGRAAIGKDFDVLERAGRIRFESKASDIRKDWAQHDDAHAVTLESGQVVIFRDVAAPDAMGGYLLHELGVHAGISRIFDEKGFEAILKSVDGLLAKSDPATLRAEAVLRRTQPDLPGDDFRHELLAHLVQHAPDAPLVQKTIATVKAWVIKHFPSLAPKLANDRLVLRQLAMLAIRDIAADVRGGRRSALFSKSGGTVAADQPSKSDFAARLERAGAELNEGQIDEAFELHREFLEVRGRPTEDPLGAVPGEEGAQAQASTELRRADRVTERFEACALEAA
ncbi:MAG: LPD23 domain-containing protein [Pseudomonadota bacterium]